MTQWMWVPVTIAAAAAQATRNAAQRDLTAALGTLAASLTRFVFAMPFALLALAATDRTGPSATFSSGVFVAWIALSASAQLFATVCLLLTMRSRSFLVGTAFTKTDALQTLVFATVMLGEGSGGASAAAIVASTAGVVLLSIGKRKPGALGAWLSRGTLTGLAAGAGIALTAIGFRGAMLEVGLSARTVAEGLVLSLALQIVPLAVWLSLRDPGAFVRIAQCWRRSLLAGVAGALATTGWLVAYSLHGAAEVRALGLVEVLFSWAIARGVFREPMTRRETFGTGLLVAGLVGVAMRA